MRRETLVCDTSFVGHFLRRRRQPERYAHWSETDIARVRAAILAISIVTVAELRAGYIQAGWSSRRVADAERRWAGFSPVLIDDPYLNEWARLRTVAWKTGIAISDNDLWVAATASVRSRVLVTCDRDHLRIARALNGEVLFFEPPI